MATTIGAHDGSDGSVAIYFIAAWPMNTGLEGENRWIGRRLAASG